MLTQNKHKTIKVTMDNKSLSINRDNNISVIYFVYKG